MPTCMTLAFVLIYFVTVVSYKYKMFLKYPMGQCYKQFTCVIYHHKLLVHWQHESMQYEASVHVTNFFVTVVSYKYKMFLKYPMGQF